MSSALKRLHSATGTVALVLALLALVASAAGVGYAAGQIGTGGIQNNAITAKKIKKNAVTSQKIKKNAVTGKKIKNGSVTVADLARQEAQHQPAFSNGGEGDCVWQTPVGEVPGIGSPTYRLDRNGRVILAGVAAGSDAAGGDGNCDTSDTGQVADGIAFLLPPRYIPAKTQYISIGGAVILITGPQGFTNGSTTLPPGAVFGSEGIVFLDNVSFDPVGSKVVPAKMKPSGRWTGNLL